MGNTIYAAFQDASLAEKAAGALLDHGVRAEDISIVRGHEDGSTTSTQYDTTSPVPVNEQTWTGENRNVEANRLGYTGNVYDTETTTNLGANAAATELQSESTNYGSTATGAAMNDNATEYPRDREIENQNASSGESRNSGDPERAAKQGISTTTPADAGAGALKGVGWGAGLGVLAASRFTCGPWSWPRPGRRSSCYRPRRSCCFRRSRSCRRGSHGLPEGSGNGGPRGR